MMTSAERASQDLTANLIGFIDNEVTPPTPAPAPAMFFIVALGLAGLVARKRS